MSATHLLAIDQGTTNTKVVLVDAAGAVVAEASRPVECRFPRPGWVEQDPLALWASVREAIDACLAGRAGLDLAVAITNQRESAVLWERDTGRPLGPVVSWQCGRTAGACEAMRRRGVEAFVRARTGLPLGPMFSATKMRWLLEAAVDGVGRAERGALCLGTVDSFLLWQLTGGALHATDPTNASRTLLLDLRRLDWDPELCALFGVPAAALPAVRPSSGPFGETHRVGALPAGRPILAVAGDSHAALCGQGAFAPGPVKATYGTGSSLMTATAAPVASAHGLATTVAWTAAGKTTYALEGNIPVTGAVLDWLAGLLGIADGAAGVLALASRTDDSDGVHVVPAFAGLGAPHWDEGARGLVTGLHRGSAAPQLARAAAEAIAFQVGDVLEAMETDAGGRFERLLADGGASRSDLLMQLQADLAGRPVERTRTPHAAALGVAGLAGLAAGIWPSPEAFAARARGRDRFEPRMPAAEASRRRAAWREAVDRARTRQAEAA